MLCTTEITQKKRHFTSLTITVQTVSLARKKGPKVGGGGVAKIKRENKRAGEVDLAQKEKICIADTL